MSAWWHELSGPAKFRLYTRLTLQSSVAAVVIVMAFTVRAPWAVAGVLAAGLIAILALEVQPEFAGSTGWISRRWVLPVAVAVQIGILLTFAVIARLATEDEVTDRAAVTGLYTAILATYSLVSFLRHRWWATLGIAVVTGLLYGSSPLAVLGFAGGTYLAGIALVGTTLLTLWGLRVVEELDRAKGVEAELQVAEERLRFARDLHDVVGRSFSAIAVKSELAAVLSRSGKAEPAAAEMDEVRTLAVESMDQMRTLVRGYRGIDLMNEVAGARSLLSAVGCRLDVEGDPANVPARCHEVAAWVVREGTTNIVEHSAATTAVLALGAAGMSLRNDRPHGAPGARSGLRGVAERLAAIGATLDVLASDEQFLLEIRWEKE
ncbi:sensor histidine kinase [Nocardia vulneris]|uniref:Histidine kinase n=1 Tax=Nocardia vulneris TaxID=1141657 RepID=A0ABR4Z7M2_9NOCA|nr:histidine kinase [Nocardia vulneris]KIA61052.1 histidine kinase [Nocardia vulneris]